MTRYKCISCRWSGYRREQNLTPCCKCGSGVEIVIMKSLHRWTKKEDNFIRKNFKKYLYPQLAQMMKLTETQISNRISKLGLRLSKKELSRRKELHRFVKGQVSWNKGLNLPNKPNTGQFNKGHRSANELHDGAIVLRKHYKRTGGDYLFIRLAKMVWIPLHNYLWNKNNGPIPKGSCVRFKDGDHLNCRIENLELVDRKENLNRNRPASKMDLIYSDRYIASKLGVLGKEKQKAFIEKFYGLIEVKRNQLLLRRGLNAARRKIAVNG